MDKAARQHNSASDAFATAGRWTRIGVPDARAEILNREARDAATTYAQNIENYIGTVAIPVGLVGPLRINGRGGTQDYQVPLATTEAALVASYSRGAGIIVSAGGCNARVVSRGVSRTPMFAFRDVVQAEQFAKFVSDNDAELRGLVPNITRYGRLKDVQTIIEGNHVYLDLCFDTGDAAGQNMVTFAADAIAKHLVHAAPITPEYWFLEANLSGDKKATAGTLAGVRGKRVIADVEISSDLIASVLHTTPDCMAKYWSAGAIGGAMSGAIGIEGHFANGLAALFLACGQDVACVAEAAVGVTRIEVTASGNLYASVTLPNVIVGTVGGGTSLPSAKACLDILGLAGTGGSDRFAEVCAGLVLAGELSIIGAFCSGDFATAHRALSRGETMLRERDNA